MSESALPLPQVTAPSTWRSQLAAYTDDLRLALMALAGHKTRAALTLLGIVIGVWAVVTTMAGIQGLQKSIDEGGAGLGADVFQIQKMPNMNFGPPSPEIQKRKNLTLGQVLALREQLPQAKQVGGEVWEAGKELSTGENSLQGNQVAGGTAEFFTNNSLPIAKGRGFSDNEAMSDARVVVLGAGVVDALFPDQDPIGRRVRLGRLDLEVIGVIERQGGSPFGGNPDKIAAIPIGLFVELYGNNRSVNITVMAKEHGDMQRLQDLAVGAFRRIRGVPLDKDDDFFIYSNDSSRQTFDQMASIVRIVALVLCGFSLLVGGIGVMNIMLVAVTERTREIGLRKALGARRARILRQFVIEATLLATIGGITGVLIGYASALLMRFAVNVPASVPLWAVALAIGVSGGIGLAAGIYPAARASQLDAAVALRNE